MCTKRKFSKTTIQVEILSEEPYRFESLLTTAYHVVDKECSAKITVLDEKDITAKQALKAIRSHGVEPEFLGINADGEEIP